MFTAEAISTHFQSVAANQGDVTVATALYDGEDPTVVCCAMRVG